MEVIFRQAGEYPQEFSNYRGESDPRQHLKISKDIWNRKGVPKELWVHGFIHTLGTFPKARYIQEEIRRKMGDCDILKNEFVSSFSF